MAPLSLSILPRAGSPGLNAASSSQGQTPVSKGAIIGLVVAGKYSFLPSTISYALITKSLISLVVLLLGFGVYGIIRYRRKKAARKAEQLTPLPTMTQQGAPMGGGQMPYHPPHSQQQQWAWQGQGQYQQ